MPVQILVYAVNRFQRVPKPSVRRVHREGLQYGTRSLWQPQIDQSGIKPKFFNEEVILYKYYNEGVSLNINSFKKVKIHFILFSHKKCRSFTPCLCNIST